MKGAQHRTKKLPDDVKNYLRSKVEEYVIETCGKKLEGKTDLILGRLIINLMDLSRSNVDKTSQRIHTKRLDITVELLKTVDDKKLKNWIKLSSENKPLPADPSFKLPENNEKIEKKRSL